MQRKTVVRRCQTVNVPARREYRLTRRFPLRAQDGLSDDGHRLTDGLSDGRGLMQAARCTASRCDRSVTAPACKPWAAPLVRPHRCPWDARQGTHKRFSGAGRGEVAKRCRAACWPIQGCLRASAGRGRRIGASLDGQRFEARKERA